jgi:hypothetical protein
VIAVWSLWTKPLRELPHSVWASERHHLLSWILSVETARQHYPCLSLVTDDAGARMLVDGLGLRFDSVSTELNGLERHDPRWWALGKLYAYRAQQEPFVHVDADVYLWKKLSEQLVASSVFGQSPEAIDGPLYNNVRKFKRLASRGAWIPEELTWSKNAGQPKFAVCCGIMGGTDMDLINHYASTAIRLAEEKPNKDLWLLEEPDNLLVEQFFLSVCVDYRRQGIVAPANPPRIGYLFANCHEPYDPQAASRVGYTHLIGRAKQNRYLLDLLERRVSRDYPSLFQRCERYCKSNRRSGYRENPRRSG